MMICFQGKRIQELVCKYTFVTKYFIICSDVKNKWESSSWGRKLIVQKKRASLNDFDRFKIMLAKIKVRLVPHLFNCIVLYQV